MIMFRLVNIPTFGSESSHKARQFAVKKWDKRAVGGTKGAGLPNHAYRSDRFSKTGQWYKSIFFR